MRTHRRFLSGLLAAVLALSLAALPALAADEVDIVGEAVFADVEVTAWYAEAVAYCKRTELMTGVTETLFDPSGTMTRSTWATVLYRMAGRPASTGANPFSDVVADSWYGPAVIWAAEQGLVRGYGDGRFGPDDLVSREQLAVFLWRYDGSPTVTGAGSFTDEASIADWADEAVHWAWADGVMEATAEGHFLPGDNALRSELASALMEYNLLRHPELDAGPTLEETPDETPEENGGDTLEIAPWAQFQAAFGYQPALQTVASNGYISEGFQLAEITPGNSYMTYAYAPYTIGIDVSSHQREIDWRQVAASGVQFAMIRVGYRGYTRGSMNLDSYFLQNIQGALNAGLKVGVYFFSQAVTVEEAVEEANYVLERIASWPISYPVVFDWERQDKDTSRTQNTSEEMVAACAAAFCETVKAAGYTPMFYGSPSKAYKMDLGYLADYPFWLAHYTKAQIPSSYRNHFDMWQFSSSWSVPGINGNVDVNICMRTEWQLR